MSEASNTPSVPLEWRLTLAEIWDDYATVIDEHASKEVRREARLRMLRRFAHYDEQGWLDPGFCRVVPDQEVESGT